MTENEIVKQAIRCIVGACDETCKGYDAKKSVCNGYSEVASGLETVLKDYEQYRAIGTVEELQNMKDHLLMVKGMCKDYYEVGTIDEFKALKEKNEPKEMDRYYCPICRHYFEDTDAYNYCPVCGQKMKSILE